jgi:glycosyltransferase involved in cell wall biosynthesis
VASRVGGIPEIAHRGNARLAPPNSPAALAEAIHECLVNPSKSATPAPRTRQAAVAELECFFEEVCSRVNAAANWARSTSAS